MYNHYNPVISLNNGHLWSIKFAGYSYVPIAQRSKYIDVPRRWELEIAR